MAKKVLFFITAEDRKRIQRHKELQERLKHTKHLPAPALKYWQSILK